MVYKQKYLTWQTRLISPLVADLALRVSWVQRVVYLKFAYWSNDLTVSLYLKFLYRTAHKKNVSSAASKSEGGVKEAWRSFEGQHLCRRRLARCS